jgi:tetratricopeptide (TPR) repeat protein
MGAHSEAIALCERALRIGRNYAYPPGTAAILDTLGTSLNQTGDSERALTSWREASDIFDRFADPRAAELRARLHVLETNSQPSRNSNYSPVSLAEITHDDMST